MGTSPPVPEELFSVDAYVRQFDSRSLEADREQGRVALARTAFYPGGGGQPHDTGTLAWDGGRAVVARVGRDAGRIWHWLDGDQLPAPGTEVVGTVDWDRRHLLMRTHTALHILCGVVWADYRVAVTGGNMEPGVGRIDFELDAISAELGRRLEQRVNEEIVRAHEIVVEFLARAEADLDPALIRTKADLIPAHIDPLRVIDIVGLDRQADGGDPCGHDRRGGPGPGAQDRVEGPGQQAGPPGGHRLIRTAAPGRTGVRTLPDERATAMTTIATAPLELSPAQLDELFASSPAGAIPAGRGAGTAVFYPGSRAAKPVAAAARALLWQGKIFRPESHDLKNLLTPFSLKGIRAEVYTGDSWFDGRPCIVLDYAKSSKVARQIRDEIRQIGPDEYLGMVFMGARRLGVYFFLRFG